MANGIRVSISYFLAGASLAVGTKKIHELLSLVDDHKGDDVSYSLSNASNEGTENVGRKLERDGNEAGRREAEGGKAGGKPAAEADDDGKPAGKPRGRPRKSADGGDGGDGNAEASRPAGGKRDDGKRAEASENRGRNVASRTDEGADEGDGDRAEGRRSAGRGRDAERGDRETARVSTGKDRGEADEEGWGDEKSAPAEEWEEESPRLLAARKPASKWPDDLLPCSPDEIDKTVITTLLSDHFTATGGKNKALTMDVMEKVAGVRAIKDVSEDDYDALARALMHDAARYEFGLNEK